MNKFWAWVIGIVIALAIIAGCAFLEGALLFWLWNWIVPTLWTSAPMLTYWQSFGLFLLLNLIGRLFRKTTAIDIKLKRE